jgi:hypothetical protein
MNKIKSRTVPLLVKREQWAEAVETAVDSHDSSTIAYVLKAATHRNQDEIVRECITKHVFALNSWLQLHPDDPNRPALLERAGLLRDALMTRYLSGEAAKVLTNRVTFDKDSLSLDVIQMDADLKAACQLLQVQFKVDISPYQLFNHALKQGDPKLVSQVAKQLKLRDDEVFRWKIDYAA